MEAAMFTRLVAHRPILVPHGGLVVASYGHVDDLCRAMVQLVSHPAAPGEVLNVTTEALTVNRYIDVLSGVVGVEADVVYVPDDIRADLTKPAWGHLLGVVHHAEFSNEKARRDFGITPLIGVEEGHRQTYEWFLAQGYDRLDAPLADTTWRSTWDFEHEDAVAAMVRDR
jgi:nucleoside-diphosphate-sugar epimerase